MDQLHADGGQGGEAADQGEDEVAEGEICNQEQSWALGFTFTMNDNTEDEDN